MIKFFVLFVFGISFLFFSLIYFQEKSFQKHPPMPPSGSLVNPQDRRMPPDPRGGYFNPPDDFEDNMQHEDPPTYIPCLLVAALSSIFIFILLKYLDKNFIAPLMIIEEKLNEINAGNLDVKLETKSENKEIQDTFKILNSMILGLVEKEKLQDEFIRNLAHDLRSPVIAQERAIAILQDEFKNHELLDGLMENSEAYLKMINLVIEAHNKRDVVINKTEFNFSNLVSAVFNGLTSLAQSKNIKLINNIDSNLFIYADYISMNRIIMNLVSNAIENIGFNKEIKISAIKEETKTTISVEDNGQGMSEEVQEKIFKKHVSVNKTGKKAISGLGLSIVYELVQKNEGSIKVESEIEKYTRFIIELPNQKLS